MTMIKKVFVVLTDLSLVSRGRNIGTESPARERKARDAESVVWQRRNRRKKIVRAYFNIHEFSMSSVRQFRLSIN